METLWKKRPQPRPRAVESLQQALQVDEIVARLLVQRGIGTFEEARVFFRPSMEHLHDPFELRDMHKAVDRVLQALGTEERILVYGDYDVDGTSSVALMDSYLRKHTEKTCIYVPDRYREGYGLSRLGVDYASDNEVGLIIALDCGTRDLESIAYAREKGIDVIVCDHHRPGPELPEAFAVLNPKRPDCPYPFKELCGCGVGFKLVSALARKLGQTFEEIRPLLDLVALAIAADIVPIEGENRTLAFLGLQQLNRQPRPGLARILPEAFVGNWTAEHLVFSAAPRINAAGRMDHATRAIYLLQSESPAEAEEISGRIEGLNDERKEVQEQIFQEALSQIRERGDECLSTTVVYAPHWHKGVIGIVASKLIERFHRPTVVFCGEGQEIVGSARSVPGFDLYEALEGCSHLLTRFGGHTHAAGMSLLREDLEDFRNGFEARVRASLGEEPSPPEIEYDVELGLPEITARLHRIIKQFEPFGPANPRPLFRIRNLRDTGQSRRVGDDQSHLKVQLVDAMGHRIGGIAFGLGDKLDELQEGPVDVLAGIEVNHWKGQSHTELMVRDLYQSSRVTSLTVVPSKTA